MAQKSYFIRPLSSKAHLFTFYPKASDSVIGLYFLSISAMGFFLFKWDWFYQLNRGWTHGSIIEWMKKITWKNEKVACLFKTNVIEEFKLIKAAHLLKLQVWDLILNVMLVNRLDQRSRWVGEAQKIQSPLLRSIQLFDLFSIHLTTYKSNIQLKSSNWTRSNSWNKPVLK